MITAIQREMGSASQNMHATLDRMQDGVAQADHTAQAISGIQHSMGSLLDSATSIAEATQEHSQASQTVASHITDIHDMTRHTDEEIRRTSLATTELQARVGQLENLVGRVKT